MVCVGFGFEAPRRHSATVPAVALALALAACGGGDGGVTRPPGPGPSPAPTPTPTPVPPVSRTVDFSFSAGREGWIADYADYTAGQEATIAFEAAQEPLPAPLAGAGGYRLTSFNRSDDVVMYVHRMVEGLVPGIRYRVAFDVRMATREPPGCAGVGGAPGEGVKVKVGAVASEPVKAADGSGYVRPGFDHGGQASDGRDLVVIGDIAAASGACGAANPFGVKRLSSTGRELTAAPDSRGRLWLVLATDSGYEGLTSYYWLDGSVTLTPA